MIPSFFLKIISVHTEMTDNNAAATAGRLFYDSECAFCLSWVRLMQRQLARHGFALASLQSRAHRLAGESGKSETRRQGVSAPGEIPRPGFTETILELPDGRELGGADAAMEIARHIWWLLPLWLVSRISGVMPLFRASYRFIARHRHCASGACGIPKQTRWIRLHHERGNLWLRLKLLLTRGGTGQSKTPATKFQRKPKLRSHRTTTFFEMT